MTSSQKIERGRGRIERRRGLLSRCIRVLAVACLLPWMPSPSNAAHLECSKVISALAREKRASAGGASDLSKLAKEMGTSIAWIEHCMRTYGRRPRRPGLESAEGRENRLEALEIFEPEEPMESEDRGVLELPRIKDRQPKIRAKPKTGDAAADD